jgi:hypothetical protein
LEDYDIFDGGGELEEEGVEGDVHVLKVLRVEFPDPVFALKKVED